MSPRPEEMANAMIQRVVLKCDDLAAFPDSGLRRELLSGQPFVSPAPTLLHQDVVLQVGRALAAYAEENGGNAFVAPLDVVLTETDVVEPDVIYVAQERRAIMQERAIFGVPNFIVEVVSPGSSEIDPEGGAKYNSTQRTGCPSIGSFIHGLFELTCLLILMPIARRYRGKHINETRAKALTLPGFGISLRSLT
jgi:Putative restriction endonuclease